LTDSNLDTAVKAAVAEERKDAKEAEDTEPVGPPTKKLNHAAIMAKVENYMLETTKRIQQYEVELVETFRNVWNRELVQDEAVFDDCIKAFENVETSATKLKEIVAKFVKTTKNASETDPFK
jgi:hypothetical protein